MSRYQQQEIEYKAIDIKLLRRLLVFLKPYKKQLFFATLLAIAASALAPLRPFLTKIAIDDCIATGNSNNLAFLIVVIFFVLLVNGAMNFALTYLLSWIGQKTLLSIRLKLFSHIQSLSTSFFDKNPVGRLVTRVSNDVEALNDLFSSGLVMNVADILLIFWIIGFMFYINSTLALMTLLVLPVLLVATFIFKNRIRELFRLVRLKVAQMNSFLNEFISGIATVKLFNQELRQNVVFEEINHGHRDLMIKTIFNYAVFFPVIEMLSAITLAIIIWYSGANILSELMTVGAFIAFIQYAEMFFRPIRDLTEKYTTMQSAMAASERIFGLLDSEELLPLAKEASALEPLCESIEFRSVNFSYEPDKPVLKNVSFKVNKGETVAIVGATGAGKTSIINLLCRFYEFSDGEILIDGKDIRTIAPETLRKRIALVMQDVFLFSRTISDNISLGSSEISTQEIKNAAAALGADEFISALPDGYETKLTERGSTLSTGQRQLISFCRAYAASPDILILDEATSSIDSATEAVIERSLEKLLENRTSIIIAHRLSTIKRADRIIVLHHGEVKESGAHAELLAKNGIYAKLYKLQYSKYRI